jgi:serine/threonine protein kinase HipA of HipAB toxin-antitoxin module
MSMSVSDAAASGDELKLLYAIRDRLSEAIEDCPMRDLSPLTRRLQDTVKEIRALEEVRKKEGGGSGGSRPSGEWNPADELGGPSEP